MSEQMQQRTAPIQRSADRKTPLMKAARMGRMEAVKTLTSRSAHVNADGNNRETTLAFALREKHDVATVLRGSGAN